jgi:hypothetical protein
MIRRDIAGLIIQHIIVLVIKHHIHNMVRNRNISLVTIGVGLDVIRITIIDKRRILMPSTIGVMSRQ